jgi:HEAT repeat protein
MGRSFSSWHRLWLLVGVAALWAPTATRADDAVEVLKQRLLDPKARPAKIAEDANRLRTISDLRRGYFLVEWKEGLKGIKDDVGKRLKAKVEDGALKGDSDAKIAACILIAEIAEADQREERTRKYAAEFSDLLLGAKARKGLVHDANVTVRQVALHALGKITPPPDRAMKELKDVLRDEGGPLGPRLLAAYALTDLVKNSYRLERKEMMDTINQAVAEAVRVQGNRNEDEQIRGYGLQTILASAKIFTEYYWTIKLTERSIVEFTNDALDPSLQKLLKSYQAAMPDVIVALKSDPSGKIKLTALETISQIIISRHRLCEELQPHGRMGILPDFKAPDFKLRDKGLRIDGILAGSPADKAGLKKDDLVFEIAGALVKDFDSYMSALAGLESGEEIDIKVLRNLKKMEFKITPRDFSSRTKLLEAFSAVDPIEPLLKDQNWLAIPSLLSSKKAEDVQLKRGVMSLLERVAKDVEKTQTPATTQLFVHEVTPALSDPDRYVRWSAARTLGNISAQYSDANVFEALGQMLNDPIQRDPDLSAAAAATIEKLAASPFAAKAVLGLRTAIADPTMDSTNRIAAMKALAAINSARPENEQQANEAFPQLTSAVAADDVGVRREACLTLGQLGHPARRDYYDAAISALKLALRDDDAEVRLHASEAILNIKAPPR